MTETKRKQPMLTLEDILKLFKETDERFKETSKELDKRFKETDERLDKKFKDIDEIFKEFEWSLKELKISINELKNAYDEYDEEFTEPITKIDKKLNKRFKNIDEKFKETEWIIREINKSVNMFSSTYNEFIKEYIESAKTKSFRENEKHLKGMLKELAYELIETKNNRIEMQLKELADEYGGTYDEFIEELLINAAKRLFIERGYLINRVSSGYYAINDERGMTKINTFAKDEDFIILIEAKSKVNRKDVDEHLKMFSNSNCPFKEYKKEKKIFGAIAGITFEEDIKKYAKNKGLFVIEQIGDAVQISNDKEFKAREW